MNVNLLFGNCLDLMDSLSDKSINMILCDLPYGTTNCSWDKIIPFEQLWKQYNRIIKDNGAVVLFGQEPFSSKLRVSNLEWYKYDWDWVKSRKNGFVHAKGMPLRETERISVFSPASIRRNSKIPMQYNPQDIIAFEKKRVNYVKTQSVYSGAHNWNIL